MAIYPILQFICFTFSALAIFALHWFPWHLIIGRKLRRLEAYATGTAAIFAPPTVAILYAYPQLDSIDALWLFWLSAIGAGLATLAAWGIDNAVSNYHSMKDRIDRAELSNRTDNYPTE